MASLGHEMSPQGGQPFYLTRPSCTHCSTYVTVVIAWVSKDVVPVKAFHVPEVQLGCLIIIICNFYII